MKVVIVTDIKTKYETKTHSDFTQKNNWLKQISIVEKQICFRLLRVDIWHFDKA